MYENSLGIFRRDKNLPEYYFFMTYFLRTDFFSVLSVFDKKEICRSGTHLRQTCVFQCMVVLDHHRSPLSVLGLWQRGGWMCVSKLCVEWD